tara:strand:- start:6117 stop:6503 length:387 start_codon:yes stop_codon:yes gene_type:complete
MPRGSSSKETKEFDLNRYKISPESTKLSVTIEETGDTFELSVKQLSWSKRNQLISKCLQWEAGGSASFDGDLYVRESLKEMIVEAPWGRTTEAFLITIDSRLGAALEAIVPKAFGGDAITDIDTVKKE